MKNILIVLVVVAITSVITTVVVCLAIVSKSKGVIKVEKNGKIEEYKW